MISSSDPATLERAQPWLGTLVSIQVAGLPARDAHRAIDAAFAEVALVHNLMSFHDPASDISRINRLRDTDPVQVHPYTFAVLQRALEISAVTRGIFDITVGAELVTWGHLPFPKGGYNHGGGTWQDLELLSDGLVRVHRPLCLDVGGIAKGFAVDQATHVLQTREASRSVVNAGGDLRVCGSGSEWIALAAVTNDLGNPVIELENGSLASSEARRQPGVQQGSVAGPHVDGRSRKPTPPYRFVSVVSPECVVADALTKVILAQGKEARSTLQHFGARAYLQDPEEGWQELCCEEEVESLVGPQ